MLSRRCFDTALFIHLGTAISGAGSHPTRVLGHLVTGIGRNAGAFALAVVMVAVLIGAELLKGRIASCSQGCTHETTTAGTAVPIVSQYGPRCVTRLPNTRARRSAVK